MATEDKMDNPNLNSMNMYIQKVKKIGSGGFSNVYQVNTSPYSVTSDKFISNLTKADKQSEQNETVCALKFISPSLNSGLESLMESYIMRYVNHQTINPALGINIDNRGNISILQNIAISDAACIVRKSSFKLSPSNLKIWLWQIACGLAQLHRRNILHGDIKSGNILVFYNSLNSPKIPSKPPTDGKYCIELENTHVKLNDFSVSRLILDSEVGTVDVGRHISYTSTHRPPEVWRKYNYGFPADIWAFGCTIYELAYREYLFRDHHVPDGLKADINLRDIEAWGLADVLPHKDHDITRSKPIPIVQSSNTREPKLASLPIFDLRDLYDPLQELSKSEPNPSVLNSQTRFKLSPEWFDEHNHILNDLIIGMLNINPESRYTIWEILDHEYFADIRNTSLNNLAIPIDERNFSVIDYHCDYNCDVVTEEVKAYISDTNIINLGISIYNRLRDKSEPLQPISFKACIIVASKLLYRSPPIEFGTIRNKYLTEEINICLQLNYKLLPYSNV